MESEKRLENIEIKLENIELKLNSILDIISENKKNCEKMSSHIDFIEKTYNTIRTPLEYVKNKMWYLYGKQHQEPLPIL
jgi:archaellum component FlaC